MDECVCSSYAQIWCCEEFNSNDHFNRENCYFMGTLLQPVHLFWQKINRVGKFSLASFFALCSLHLNCLLRGGNVKVVKRREGVRVPDGWHVANVEEAKAHRDAILSQMGKWDIAELVGGKISGRSYGGKVEACGPESFGHLVILKNSISFAQPSLSDETWQSTTSGNIYTVQPPLVDLGQPPVVPAPWTPPSRSWGPATATSQPINQPGSDPSEPLEKSESEIYLKPPSYNDALTM